MTSLFLHIYDYLSTRRKLCIGLLLSFCTLLAILVATLSYSENIFDFLPMTDNQQKALTIYQDITGGQSVIVMVNRKDGDTEHTEQVTEALDAFADMVQQGSGRQHVKSVMSEIDYDKVLGITDMVYDNMPLMLDDSDYVRMERRLSAPDFTDHQLADDVEMMLMPSARGFSSRLSADPLGLFTPVMDRLDDALMSLDFELDDGHIFTPGGKYALAMVESNYGAMESASNARLVAFADSVAAAVMEQYPEVSVSLTGAPVIAVGNADQIKVDSMWAVSIAVVLITILLFFSFRRIKNFGLIGLGISFGLLFALGIIALFRSEVSLIVLGMGSVIIGIAANYPLHFVAHAEQGGRIREVLKEMVPPLLIGNITTVGAFAALLPLKALALRDLGLFSSLMLVGTILFVLIFLPHIIREQPASDDQKLPFARISSFSLEGHRWLIIIIVCLTFVFGYFSLGTSFDANVQHINYMTDEQTTLLSDLQASAGINDTTNVYVVTEADTWDEALAARSHISPTLSRMKASSLIGGYTDVGDFICTEDAQRHKIERWREFWDAHRQSVCQALAARAPQYGFTADAFDDFIRIINTEYQPRPFEYFEPLRTILLKRSFSTSTGRCAVIDVIDAKGKDITSIESQLNPCVEGAGFTFDFVGMNSSIARSLSDDFNYIGLACSIIVFVFLWLSFGRFEISVLAFLPMALGWIWILGTMNILGMQFNIINVILATFIFGQGDDYTIFITDGLINEHAYRKALLPSYKNSIIISALIIFIGMGALIVSRHPALYSLAEVTIVGMLTVVLMAWVVPPIVFHWLVRSHGAVRRNPVTAEQIVRTSIVALLYAILAPLGRLFGCTHLMMRAIIRCMPGVRFYIHNPHNASLDHASFILCHTPSFLDRLFIRSLGKDIRILTHSTSSLPLGRAGVGLSLYIHGTSHILPSGTHLIARGQVDIEIGQPMNIEHFDPQHYADHYAAFCRRIESAHYFHDYLIYKYMYKGISYEKETRRLLQANNDFADLIDHYDAPSSSVTIHNQDHGQYALLFSLVHPDIEVHSYCQDPDTYAILSAIEPMPSNLKVHQA